MRTTGSSVTDATNPVVLNYDINVRPYGTTQGQIPAIGSAMAYIKAHIQEARVNGTEKDEDLVYNEQSSAQGTITAFTRRSSRTSLASRSCRDLVISINLYF